MIMENLLCSFQWNKLCGDGYECKAESKEVHRGETERPRSFIIVFSNREDINRISKVAHISSIPLVCISGFGKDILI
jgi:hypothetical protein